VRVAAMGAVDWETLEALEGYVKLCRNRGIGELSGEEKGGQSEKVWKLEVAATMAEQEAAEYRAQWESVHAAADELRMRLKARDGEITVLEFQCEELARQLAEARSATMLPVASTANGAVSKPAEVVEVDNAGPAEERTGKVLDRQVLQES